MTDLIRRQLSALTEGAVMNTLVLTTHLVNQGIAWFVLNVHVRLLDVVAVVHALIGGLIVVTGVLLVATAGPRWRSRIIAVIVALFMVGVVAVGCAPVASAATPAATQTEGPNALVVVVSVVTVIAVGALFLAALRVAFHVLAVVARVLELVLVVRHAAVITGALALALVVVAARA
jgi:hypothetical protein